MINTFTIPIIPDNEQERLNALNRFNYLEKLPNEYFNKLAQIIAITFDSPIALVSIVESEDVYFRGNYGMEGTERVDRGKSLCSLAILNPEPTVFSDAKNEPCLLNNPLVNGSFGLRFYAGAPIMTSDGYNIGSVCIVDKQPRKWTQNESKILKKFADIAILQIESYFSVNPLLMSL